jgi:hypothetical protein
MEKENEEGLYWCICSHVIGSISLQSVYLLFFTRGHYRENSIKGKIAAELVGFSYYLFTLVFYGAIAPKPPGLATLESRVRRE